MAWNDVHTLVLRGHTTEDPTVSYVEVTLAVTWCVPVPSRIGDPLSGADGALGNRTRRRFRIDVTCMGFAREADGVESQDYWHYLKADYVLSMPYVTIWRALEEGTLPDGALVRADFNHADLTSDASLDTFWHLSDEAYLETDEGYPVHEQGRLPLAVVLDGEFEAAKNEDTGLYDCEFALMLVSPEDA
jgi:hypothetical protein